MMHCELCQNLFHKDLLQKENATRWSYEQIASNGDDICQYMLQVPH